MTELNTLIGDFRHLQTQMDIIIERMSILSARILVESQRVRNNSIFYEPPLKNDVCQDL